MPRLNRPGFDGDSVSRIVRPVERSSTHGKTFQVFTRVSRARCPRSQRVGALDRGGWRDLGIHHETLRAWVRQAEADDGTRTDRLSTAEREELAALRKEIRDLRRSNEILKAASVFSPANSTSPVQGERVHRSIPRPPWGRADMSGDRGVCLGLPGQAHEAALGESREGINT